MEHIVDGLEITKWEACIFCEIVYGVIVNNSRFYVTNGFMDWSYMCKLKENIWNI